MQTKLKSKCLVVALMAIAGCSAPKPDTLTWYDSGAAAAKAIATYDKNSDGQLTADELKASPSLLASLGRLDTNRDKKISANEIQARFDEVFKWAKYNGLDLTVMSRGRPAVGAEVTLTPEPFMGENFPTYSGKVTESGNCPLAVSDDRYLPVPVGFYTLKIVHGGKETARGVEIANDTTGSRLEIAL